MAKTNLSKLQENFTCLAIVCVDHIKLPLMDILENHIKPPDLYYEINSSTLISANKLRPDQKKLCYITPPGVPDYSKFDVTLLYTLLRNLCPSLKPSGRWGEEPAASHTQLGDDIERLRLFRNEQFAHANSAEISDGEFNNLWKDLQTVINRIQNNKKAGCKTDYLQTFKSIEKRLLNWDDLEKYKLLLEATIHASKQREDKGKYISLFAPLTFVVHFYYNFSFGSFYHAFTCWLFNFFIDLQTGRIFGSKVLRKLSVAVQHIFKQILRKEKYHFCQSIGKN